MNQGVPMVFDVGFFQGEPPSTFFAPPRAEL